MKKLNFAILLFVSISFVFFSSCEKDDDTNNNNNNQEQFKSLISPYLICASRNPGGIGFDFEYKGKTGGANNLDSLSVSNFEYDLMIKTIKAEKPDGTLGGMPYIALAVNAEAVNYSAVDTTCKGYTAFQNVTKSNLKDFTFESDDTGFDLSNLTTGNTGKPLMSEVNKEYKKLVIGDKWKAAAKNDIADDELVWIIKTAEGRWIKLIVTDFPADPAPTATGYVALEWNFVN